MTNKEKIDYILREWHYSLDMPARDSRFGSEYTINIYSYCAQSDAVLGDIVADSFCRKYKPTEIIDAWRHACDFDPDELNDSERAAYAFCCGWVESRIEIVKRKLKI